MKKVRQSAPIIEPASAAPGVTLAFNTADKRFTRGGRAQFLGLIHQFQRLVDIARLHRLFDAVIKVAFGIVEHRLRRFLRRRCWCSHGGRGGRAHHHRRHGRRRLQHADHHVAGALFSGDLKLQRAGRRVAGDRIRDIRHRVAHALRIGLGRVSQLRGFRQVLTSGVHQQVNLF